MTDPSRNNGTLLIDGHVHLHRCFDTTRFLDSAAANFTRADAGATGVLLLTESAGASAFENLRNRGSGNWRTNPTDEPGTIWMENGVGRLLICAGRQVVTREDLEVLTLLTGEVLPDGRQIEETLDAAGELGAFRVIPWGFGKWTANRGRRVASVVEDYAGDDFALGDNGGRLRHMKRPALFAVAERRGVRIFPGSDPLPFKHHQFRAGSYGLRIEGALESATPGRDLLRLLTDRSIPWARFGARERVLPFLRNQVAMQWRKRFGASS